MEFLGEPAAGRKIEDSDSDVGTGRKVVEAKQTEMALQLTTRSSSR